MKIEFACIIAMPILAHKHNPAMRAVQSDLVIHAQ